MSLAAGTHLGVYEILAPLGQGGMGEVYRARDSRLARDVAIKVLPAAFTTDPERLARFEREARTLASLNHAGIGAIYGLEYAFAAPGQPAVPALVLELVEGETLADRIRRGPIPLAVALDIARQITEALDVAHERGIVHRDLKPANIKITTDGVVKVLDFGLARTLAGERSVGLDSDPSNSPTFAVGPTLAGIVLGTAAYMSPEQARGKPVDKRADIWAFGCVLYEMLTGAVAFKGESVSDIIVAILDREPDLAVLPAATPPGVRFLLRRLLEKDVKRRVRDIADARAEIDFALAQPGGAGVALEPVAPGRARRLSWQTGALFAAGLVAAAGTGWFVGRQREPPVAAPTFDRLIRLVSTPVHEFGPVISPDGKWVAYLSDARGPTDVWVKFIAGGDPINLTASAEVAVQSQDAIGGLAVSPDGSQIAFQAQETGQPTTRTWVIPAPLGGAPRRVLPPGSGAMQWSPDGRRMAYVRAGGPLGDAVIVTGPDGQHDVEIVKRQGARHAHWIRWDAAGRFIYFNYGFQNFNIEPTEIFRAPVSGGPIEPVVTTARRAVFPCPTPDHRGLFYSANPDGVDLSLWWKDLASGRTVRVTTGVGEYGTPSVSADGQRLVGTIVEVRESLERATVAFDRPVRLERVTDGFSGDIDPAWSPRGDRLVFSSSRAGTRTLWTARGDLTHPAPVTSGTAFDERPAYSPDGEQIAFVSDRGGRRGIWMVSADARTPRLVTAADVVGAVSWSPDGRRLVYSAPLGDAPGLITVDVASGQASRLPTSGAATAPAWSPRGDVIAYVEPQAGAGGGAAGAFLKFIRPTGEVVPPPPGLPGVNNGFVSWSPDGQRLAAVSLPGAFAGSVWILEPRGRTPARKLLDLPAGSYIRGVSWSADGASVIVGRIQRSGDIFLAERAATP